jgi:hypothetical protein
MAGGLILAGENNALATQGANDLMSKDAQGRSIRRVSTGQAQGGLSVIASDEQIAPIESPLMPGAKFYSVWGRTACRHCRMTGRSPRSTLGFRRMVDTALSLS